MKKSLGDSVANDVIKARIVVFLRRALKEPIKEADDVGFVSVQPGSQACGL